MSVSICIRTSDGSEADNEAGKEEQVFCTVRADELPEEPKSSFLLRQSERKDEETAAADGEKEAENTERSEVKRR